MSDPTGKPDVKGAGRPKGKLCSWYALVLNPATGKKRMVKCRRTARVRIKLQLAASKPMTLSRCWAHYVDIENAYRGSGSMGCILRSEVIDAKEGTGGKAR